MEGKMTRRDGFGLITTFRSIDCDVRLVEYKIWPQTLRMKR